jgi:hypothetical protein
VTAADGRGGTATSNVTVTVAAREVIAFEDVHFAFDRFNLSPEALKILDDAVAKLDVRVPKYQPASHTSDGVAPALDAGSRRRGKGVYLGGDRSIQGLTVIIQARNADDEGPWTIVGAAR